MKTVLAWLGGIVVGLVVAVPVRRAVIYYSEYSLPPVYAGPKVRVWQGGVERVFDPASQGWGAAEA